MKEDVTAYLKSIGAKGGRAAGKHMTKAQRIARARKGAIARWKKGGKK